MRIDLGNELEIPRWPDGITPRTLRVGRDEPQLHAADAEAFAEHHLFEYRTYAEWRRRHVDVPTSMPGCGSSAGTATRSPGTPRPRWRRRWHGRRPRRAAAWRGRGLGLALLLEEFRALSARGVTVVRLFVDGLNATGAVELYEKAGMHVARRFDVLEKKLTPVVR